jgi:group I intron endonuclease
MIIYSIYKATCNVTNQSYIGFDSNWPNRQKIHKSFSKNPKTHFQRALTKYGWDNFVWEIIYQSKDKDHCLKIMEPYFIKSYNCFENGYNMTLGGEGTFGKKLSQESKLKISKANKGNSTTLGFKHSQETKNKISAKRKGKSFKNIPVVIDGIVYSSKKEVYQKLGISQYKLEQILTSS